MPRTVLLRVLVLCALITVAGALATGVAVGAGGAKPVAAPLTQVSYSVTDSKIAPATVTLKKGTPTKITVVNHGETQHTFTSKKLGLKMVLDPGETSEVTIKNKKAGTFMVMCTIHPSMMTTIKVK